jgi:tRNA(fMet)-specific endonuclease VapC
MSLFVLDTDILTLLERGDSIVSARVAEHSPEEIAVSVVTVEEQLSGWYAQLRQAKRPERLTWAYRRLAATVRFLSRVRILDYEEAAIKLYEGLKQLKTKVRKMDLQIAATALHHGGTLVTRNVRDFEQVPGLRIEDWSKEPAP